MFMVVSRLEIGQKKVGLFAPFLARKIIDDRMISELGSKKGGGGVNLYVIGPGLWLGAVEM